MKDTIKNIGFAWLLVLAIAGCDRRQARSTGDKEIHIEVQKATGGDGMSSVQVRLFPAVEPDAHVKENLLYRMDSCFYLEQNGRRTYPAAIVPVASGVRGCFEYLISFEPSAGESSSLQLLYQDKYLNRKRYQLYPQF